LKIRKQPHSTMRTMSEGSMAQQILMGGGPHSTKCHKGLEEAIPGAQPLATLTLGRRPQQNGQPTTARTSVTACSDKSNPFSDPEGPRRGCVAS